MILHLFNTLSGQIEPLVPIDGAMLRMYACGPTVYDYGHIGNFRTFVHVDLLRRTLEAFGTPVKHVMNITDVDDKIIRNAAAAGLPIADYTRRFEEAFLEDLGWLGVERPTLIPHATAHIPEMVALVQKLEANGLAYRTEDGSWYFRIAGFPEYGKLSKKDLSGMENGARVDVDEYEKDSARDFALWKAPKPGEHHWASAIGAGRPGWHLECSAMALHYLGDSFDLHAGGEDLMFPHHENEIAQSESATHQPFARHWFHVRFLLVEGRKMSKSEGNFFTLRDLLLRGYKASAIRSLLLSVPYGQQLNFTFEGLAAETAAIERLRTFRERMRGHLRPTAHDQPENPTLAAEIEKNSRAFDEALAHDLNAAAARAAIFETVRAANIAADAGALGRGNVEALLELLTRFDRIFAVLSTDDAAITAAAVAWAECEGRVHEVNPELLAQRSLSDAQIQALVDERMQARRNRNFARSDAIREELAAKGVVLEDSKDGMRWHRR
jgi:cysteinyl-tRNA synthetase